MQRNNSLIVRRFFNGYNIILPGNIKTAGLFYSQEPYSEDKTHIADITGSEIVIPDPRPDSRIYFTAVFPDGAKLTAADPAITLPPIENFRDMGGYLTQGGKTVKWGIFFRSGALSGLSAQNKAYFDTLNIKTILDYRAEGEAKSSPDYVPSDTDYCGVPSIKAVMDGTELDNLDMVSILRSVKTEEQAQQIAGAFTDIYKTLPFNNPSYKEMFARLDMPDRLPIIQHCTAGKDRTGIGSALLLIALGVDEQTVIEDYCLSAVYREQQNKIAADNLAQTLHDPAAVNLAAQLLTVNKTMIQTALTSIHGEYPSFAAFFKKEYRITEEHIAGWRKQYVI